METTERLQQRIATLADLHTIVKTMRVLSAVNIRQYEQSVSALSDYATTVELGLHVVLRDMEIPIKAANKHASEQYPAAIVFGSDHGLCGRFNEEIASHVAQHLTSQSNFGVAPRLLTVGSRVTAALEALGIHAEQQLTLPGSASAITSTVQQLLLSVDQWRSGGQCSSITLYHNRTGRGGGYQQTHETLWPVDPHRFKSLESRSWPSRRVPTYSVERNLLLASLLRQFFFITLFRSCAESQSAEHASRLSSMQSAQKNIVEKRDELTTQFRRVRQEAITTELLDVVSGFDAVMTQ